MRGYFKNTKRYQVRSMVLVFVLAVLVALVGCGGNSDSSTTGEGPVVEENADATKVETGSADKESKDVFAESKELFAGSNGGKSDGGLGLSSGGAGFPSDVEDALKDAKEASMDLAKMFANAEKAKIDSKKFSDCATRLADDYEIVEKASKDSDSGQKEAYSIALKALENAQEACIFYLQFMDVFNQALAGNETKSDSGSGMLESSLVGMDMLEAVYEGTGELDVPQYAKQPMDSFRASVKSLFDAYGFVAKASADADNMMIAGYSGTELVELCLQRQTDIMRLTNDNVAREFLTSSNSIDMTLIDMSYEDRVMLDATTIKEVSPNLYPTYDSVANIHAMAFDDKQAIVVEAEIPGFTQKYETRFDLNQGENFIQVKPALLPMSDMSKLDTNWSGQLNFTVTDEKSGKKLAQQTDTVAINDIYDFTWVDEDYGHTVKFDILAWLRPQAIEVDQINQSASKYLNDVSGGKISLAGYQYSDPLATLWQVAAIQKAISDAGVLYTMDGYSLNEHQQILTPDQVVQRKHGLCIESTLLMSSCLLKAGMHPVIVLSPSHAQVAVETTRGSGKYALIETTTLPYEGLNSKYKQNDPRFYNGLLATNSAGEAWTLEGGNEEWAVFLAEKDGEELMDGDVYFIDCDLQQTLKISGLESYTGEGK